MRYINEIFTAPLGKAIDNRTLLPIFEMLISNLRLSSGQQDELLNFVRYNLVGERTRNMLLPDVTVHYSFKDRAAIFETGAEQAVNALANQIVAATHEKVKRFDALLCTTSTGNLMPGLSYRLAKTLGGLVDRNSMLIDLANVGCTGSLKALNVARSLDDSFKNILVLAVEIPSTLVDVKCSRQDVWQGHCTFGDGAAAMWVSTDPKLRSMALALEELHYCHEAAAGANLIRWDYHDYYRFAMEDNATFERDVRKYVTAALQDTAEGWRSEPRWAIHPAGISLLVRIGRKLGIPSDSLAPSVAHYRRHSNMSSASILHILKDVATQTPVMSAINLLTMGAGFNVIYGRVRKEA